MNKKIALLALFCAVSVSSSVQAFSLSDVSDISGNKIKLQSCLAEEAKKSVTEGKIAETKLDTLARQIATTCVSKLSLKNVDDSTVTMAKNILNAFAK